MESIDWHVPWLASLRDLGAGVATINDWRTALNKEAQQRSIRNHHHLPIHFIAQHELPANTAYEAHIGATGKVPTRDNLHDFFNALVWLTFPKLKAQLNALQARQIEHLGVGKTRGTTRDAATLFDENAAFLMVSDTPEGHAIVQALWSHEWHQLFVQERQQFQKHAEVMLFGHALMEKLVHPYKAITAHTLVCWVEPGFFALNLRQKCMQVDQELADQLKKIELAPTTFSPLPILGVPGWWLDQTAEFYADTSVFRPARQKVNPPRAYFINSNRSVACPVEQDSRCT